MYEIFEKLCKAKGITPYRFGKDMKVNSSTISTWKTKNSLAGPELAQKVCDYFGVTIDFLMGKTDSVTCPICGFECDPTSKEMEDVHAICHTLFFETQKMFPQYLPYHLAEKLRSQSLRVLQDVNFSNDEKLEAFEQYLVASFSLELSRLDYDELEYADYEKFCMHEVGNAFACSHYNIEFKDMLIERYGINMDFIDVYNSNEMIIERAKNNEQLIRILKYAENINPEMLDAIEIQLKALAEQNTKE